MADNLKTIKQALETDGVYTGLTKGNSMEPLIHHQQDNIIVVRPNGRLKKIRCCRLSHKARQIYNAPRC